MPLLLSHRHRFLFQSIAKNASSTLRAELGHDRFAAAEIALADVEAVTRRHYFTFAFVRHPVTRFLSSYQEISMRLEQMPTQASAFAFAALPDRPERLQAFVDQAEQALWDPHIARQVDFLAGLHLDFLGRVESLQEDLATVYDRLGLAPPSVLPHRRSRRARAQVHGYERYGVRERDLAADTRDRIEALYHADLALWRSVTEQPKRCSARTDSKPSATGPTTWQRPRIE